jgi:SM-20-related protein
MQILNLDAFRGGSVSDDPYRHFTADDVIRADARADLHASFPDIAIEGTVVPDDAVVRGAFAALIADLKSPEMAAVMSEKLGLDLTTRPVFINMSRWCKRTDGRIHTDSASKLATLLVYMNPTWENGSDGCFRVLRGEHDFEDFTMEVPPLMGKAMAFRRADNSWHGFRPFAGERRMVQTTWLLDDSKLQKKMRSGRRANWIRRLNPFRKS